MSMKIWDFPLWTTIPAGRRTVTATPRYKCDELIGLYPAHLPVSRWMPGSGSVLTRDREQGTGIGGRRFRHHQAVYRYPCRGTGRRFVSDREGFALIAGFPGQNAAGRVVMEATGRFHRRIPRLLNGAATGFACPPCGRRGISGGRLVSWGGPTGSTQGFCQSPGRFPTAFPRRSLDPVSIVDS